MKRPFEEFKYATSPYDLLQEARSRERLDSQRAQEQLHGGAPGPARESDPYDTARDEQLRSKWIEEKKVLAGSFLPPGRDKGLSRPSRAMLTDMMTHLYKTLYDDWEDAKPAVFTTAEDLIVVYFALDNLRNDTGARSPTTSGSLATPCRPPSAGLLAYMNVMARRSPLVQAYELHKANEGWGIQTEDNHKMFTFRPPWVKERRFTNFRPAPPSEGS